MSDGSETLAYYENEWMFVESMRVSRYVSPAIPVADRVPVSQRPPREIFSTIHGACSACEQIRDLSKASRGAWYCSDCLEVEQTIFAKRL